MRETVVESGSKSDTSQGHICTFREGLHMAVRETVMSSL